MTGAALVATFELLGLYTLRVLSSFVKKMPAIVLGWTIAFAGLVAAIFFLKIGADVSRVWLATWYRRRRRRAGRRARHRCLD